MVSLWTKKFSKNSLDLYEERIGVGDATANFLIEKFEDQLAEEFGRNFAIFCSSGTGALVAALYFFRQFGFTKVSMPSTSWIANLNAVVATQMHPFFRDTNPSTLLAKWNRNTEEILTAIIHISGRISYPESLSKSPILEDFSQAHFSELEGYKAGKIGQISVASTGITKSLTTIHGGIILCDDENVYEWLKTFIRNGVTNNLVETWGHFGLNFKPNAANASIGLSEIANLQNTLEKIRAVKKQYIKELSEVEFVTLLPHRDLEIPLYVELHCEQGKKLKQFLLDRDIQVKMAPPPMFEAGYIDDSGSPLELLPGARKANETVVILPSGPDLTSEAIRLVTNSVKDFFRV